MTKRVYLKREEIKEFRYATRPLPNNMIYEVEYEEILVVFSLITDTGDKIVLNEKNSKEMKNKIFEIYLSKRLTLLGILEILCDKFKIKIEKSRLWVGDNLINESQMSFRLEKAFQGNNIDVYIEQVLENSKWPTDYKEMNKIIDKNKKRIQKTKGLANLGNSCYMNSALQALAHTPYFKEYFAGIIREKSVSEPYKLHINEENPMGHHGELASQFSSILKSMWKNRFSVSPQNFKKFIGKINDQWDNRDQQDA